MTSTLDQERTGPGQGADRLLRKKALPRFVLVAVAAPALALLALLCWGFSSPVGSSPDDDYHLASIWCAQGERPGLCEQSDSSTHRLVPTPLTSFRCYVYYPNQSAGCFDAFESDLAQTQRFDRDHSYPPVFYAVMSLFAGPNVAESVGWMRAANAVLAVGLWTAVFWLLPRFTRPAFLATICVTSVPLLLFLVPSTNPSSWALISVSFTWVCAWAAYHVRGARQWWLSGFVVVGALIGSGARADAAAFTVMAVVLAGILGFRWVDRARQAPPLVASVIAAILAAYFYTGANQAGAVVNGLPSSAPPLTKRQLVENVLQLPSLWQGAIGGPGWGLGWLDTALPAAVPFFSTALFGGAIIVNLRRFVLRRVVAVSACAFALVVMPYILLMQTHAVVGTQVQPRYILPLMMLLVGMLFAYPSARQEWVGIRYWVATVVIASTAAIALHVNLQRYTTGLDVLSFDPGARAEWWWAGLPAPAIVWSVGSLSLLGFFLAVGWAFGFGGTTLPIEGDASRSVSEEPRPA